MALFRYSAGKPGFNLVTVYERYEGGPIQVEWWPRGVRKREPLRPDGKRVYDQRFAVRVADRMATHMERVLDRTRQSAILGLPEKRTLGELLSTYHDKRGTEWSPTNVKSMENMRDFWRTRLGRTTDVRQITAADVELIAAEEAVTRKWSPRTQGKYLKYLKTASRYGRLKLKWYGEEHDLSAVDVPTPDSDSEEFSLAEVRALLLALEAVDLRAAVAGHIAYVSLRRVGAIMNLPAKVDIRTMKRASGGDSARIGVVTFGRATDKVRRTAQVVLAGRALELLEMLMQLPAVQASGLMFPQGDLHDPSPSREIEKYDSFHGWLMTAAKIAGVADVKKRKWHAFKRSAATDSDAMGSLSSAAKQAGTLESTLKANYVKHRIEEKAEHAIRLAALVSNG